jgi:hypothetical protein
MRLSHKKLLIITAFTISTSAHLMAGARPPQPTTPVNFVFNSITAEEMIAAEPNGPLVFDVTRLVTDAAMNQTGNTINFAFNSTDYYPNLWGDTDATIQLNAVPGTQPLNLISGGALFGVINTRAFIETIYDDMDFGRVIFHDIFDVRVTFSISPRTKAGILMFTIPRIDDDGFGYFGKGGVLREPVQYKVKFTVR